MDYNYLSEVSEGKVLQMFVTELLALLLSSHVLSVPASLSFHLLSKS